MAEHSLKNKPYTARAYLCNGPFGLGELQYNAFSPLEHMCLTEGRLK